MMPRILLTCSTGTANQRPTWSLNQEYSEGVRLAGGIPIPAAAPGLAGEYAALADGLLLTGGVDVAPERFGETTRFDSVHVDSQRDALEWELIPAFLAVGKPVFGICRGIQILNVYFGGTLWQDLPIELGQNHSGGILHPVTIKKGSILESLYGTSMTVNSFHHQAIRQLGRGLTATAWAEAGDSRIVEAVEHDSFPVWAVQWHPERLVGAPRKPEEAGCRDSLPLFSAFLEQCRRFAGSHA